MVVHLRPGENPGHARSYDPGHEQQPLVVSRLLERRHLQLQVVNAPAADERELHRRQAHDVPEGGEKVEKGEGLFGAHAGAVGERVERGETSATARPARGCDRRLERARSRAAPTNPANSGWGRLGRDRNSGWNWEPTIQGWSLSSHISTSEPSGSMPLAIRPAASSSGRNWLLNSERCLCRS